MAWGSEINEADSTLSRLTKLEILAPNGLQTIFLCMFSISFIHLVRVQVDMAFGRFENAKSAAERTRTLDLQNQKAARVLAIVKSVSRACLMEMSYLLLKSTQMLARLMERA